MFLKIHNLLTNIHAVFVKTIYQLFAQQDEINNNCGNVEEEANYATATVAKKSNIGSLGVSTIVFVLVVFLDNYKATDELSSFFVYKYLSVI